MLVFLQRSAISIGTAMIGACIGFFCVMFVAELVLPPPDGPTPYGNWNSVGHGVVVGIPLGAISGFIAGLVFTRKMTSTESDVISYAFIWKGAIIGIVAGLLLMWFPIYEAFTGLAKLVIGIAWIGSVVYFVFFRIRGSSNADARRNACAGLQKELKTTFTSMSGLGAMLFAG
ncbi:MAG: hypothetical protein ACKVH8_19625 [Pirellulales bacterium]|jgi:hypothetical protein